jgi:mannose-6-phosphate isomerase class I
MKLIDTHSDPKIGALSIQVHPKVGHPSRPSKPEMWKGEGKIYLGWKKDMSPSEIIKSSENGSLEKDLNQIDLTPEQLILVHGGIIHAIRANSFLAEWSKAPGGKELIKGNLSDATLAVYDRTDGKKARPGKEHLKESIELMKVSGTFKRYENFNCERLLIKVTDDYNRYFLFQTEEVFVEEWDILKSLVIKNRRRGLPFYLEKGQIKIHFKGGSEIFIQGEEGFIPHGIGDCKFENISSTVVKMQLWYAPFSDEKNTLLT